MSQPHDNNPADTAARQEWLSVLARAPAQALRQAMQLYWDQPRVWLRAPQTGLMMVQARAGGTGERFNFGEVTVTRCVLRLAQEASVGVGYVRGRSRVHAECVALADALLQLPSWNAQLARELLQPLRDSQAREAALQREAARKTQVEFFTVAREAGAQDGEDA